MNSNAIETLAIGAVRESIVTTEILGQYIADNDKEPSWDGFIYVYKDKNHRKDNLRGRVPVQVKGELNANQSLYQISYAVEIADLLNYKNDGGIIFFVVYINHENPNQKKIYYASLTPVKIISYIKDAESQKTKTIKLKEFPYNSQSKSTIILNLLNDNKKQISFVNQNLIVHLADLKDKKPDEYTMSIQGYSIGKDKNSLLACLSESELYLYVTFKGSNALLPTDAIIASLEEIEIVECDISINGEIYYRQFERIRSATDLTIKVNDSMSLTSNLTTLNTITNIDLNPYLRKRAKDLQFILDALDTGNISIGEKELKFSMTEKELQKFNIGRKKQELTYYLKVIQLLDYLHVKEDINLDKLTKRQMKDIDVLISSIIDEEEIEHITIKKTPAVVLVEIDNLKLKLVVNNSVKSKNAYTIHNFFHPNLQVTYLNDKGDHLMTSPYSALDVDDYLGISNIDYDGILPSYKIIERINQNIFERANIDMLTMLLAYDKKQDEKLFTTIKDLSDWIFQNDVNGIPNEIKILNHLQIIRRERSLTKDELWKLVIMTENNFLSNEIKVAAHLLQGNQSVAEIYFDKMNKNEQKLFKAFPIYRFWDQILSVDKT